MKHNGLKIHIECILVNNLLQKKGIDLFQYFIFIINKLIRSIDYQDNIQQLLSPLKRLKTDTTSMEVNDETTVKTELTKTNPKCNYLVKVIPRKKQNKINHIRII